MRRGIDVQSSCDASAQYHELSGAQTGIQTKQSCRGIHGRPLLLFFLIPQVKRTFHSDVAVAQDVRSPLKISRPIGKVRRWNPSGWHKNARISRHRAMLAYALRQCTSLHPTEATFPIAINMRQCT
jgi:hypothetical protein